MSLNLLICPVPQYVTTLWSWPPPCPCLCPDLASPPCGRHSHPTRLCHQLLHNALPPHPTGEWILYIGLVTCAVDPHVLLGCDSPHKTAPAVAMLSLPSRVSESPQQLQGTLLNTLSLPLHINAKLIILCVP